MQNLGLQLTFVALGDLGNKRDFSVCVLTFEVIPKTCYKWLTSALGGADGIGRGVQGTLSCQHRPT